MGIEYGIVTCIGAEVSFGSTVCGYLPLGQIGF
jgi:hypothetical protein